jgi:ADP-heptose:LPS heptosyltransferase
VFPQAGRVVAAQGRLAALGDRPRLALHVSARAQSRRWPEARWVEASHLAASRGWGIVLLWSPGAPDNPFHPGDDDLAARLTRALVEVPHVAMDTPRIPELVAVLACCDAFVGADGGAMHLAAGVGLPTVALFEHTPLKTRHWYPWHVPHEIVSGPDPGVAGIEAHRVVEALGRLPVGQHPSTQGARCASVLAGE